MPVCVHCAFPVRHLYTVYKTRSNVRLGVCPRCDQFLDPLIEHPTLILVLDLVLLRSRVYLHLLFNRGAPPLDATQPDASWDHDRRPEVSSQVAKLGAVAVATETALRLAAPTSISAVPVSLAYVVRTVVHVVAEMAAQHLTTLALALVALRLKRWYPLNPPSSSSDGRQTNFLPALIPLTLLYSSLLPLLLQLFLMIYHQPPAATAGRIPAPGFTALVPQFAQEVLLETMKVWSVTDKLWAGTRVLGGMSSGFGLRVLLPTKPWETTAIVLAGWMAGEAVGRVIDSVWSLG